MDNLLDKAKRLVKDTFKKMPNQKTTTGQVVITTGKSTDIGDSVDLSKEGPKGYLIGWNETEI